MDWCGSIDNLSFSEIVEVAIQYRSIGGTIYPLIEEYCESTNRNFEYCKGYKYSMPSDVNHHIREANRLAKLFDSGEYVLVHHIKILLAHLEAIRELSAKTYGGSA